MSQEPTKDSLSTPKQLWLNESDDYLDLVEKPDETTLFFGIFYLDKWNNRDDDLEKLNEVKAKLIELIDLWNTFYPWGNYEGIKVDTIVESGERPVVFGSLCVERHQEVEERLVVCLLQKLSERLEASFFIKTCTSEGDFLLMECHDVLPSEYQYPMGNNRLWVHQGKFKFIPVDLAPKRGIRKEEALQFLTNEYFKLSEVPDVSRRIEEITGLARFPGLQVEELVSLPLCMADEKTGAILLKDPKAISLALNNIYFNGQDTKETVVINQATEKEDKHELQVLISKAQEKFLAGFLQDSGIDLESNALPTITGQIVSASLRDLMRNEELRAPSPKGFTMDFVSILKAKSFLVKNYEPSKADFIGALRREDEITDEDVISRMQRLFSNIRMDMDSGNAQEAKDSDSSSNDDSEDLANIEAMNYFRDQNIDIDEDDFFEYFVTEALKLKQSDLDDMRHKESSSPSGSPPNHEEMQMLQELENLFGLKNQAGSV
ncbi:LAFA_0B05886g1_1 [Lachancea sp. 'fantastica']|nr:LAFA_0B05886g1_1 [Lachancea sp. 'fantastica']